MQIAFNARYLQEALQNLDQDQLALEFSGAALAGRPPADGRRGLRPRHHAGPHAVLTGARSRGAGAPTAMRVERLQLTSYRTYAAARRRVPDRAAGRRRRQRAGKTNLLESMRRARHRGARIAPRVDGELIAWGADFARLEAASADGDTVEVVVARTATGGGRKRVLVNGVRAPAAGARQRHCPWSSSRPRTCCSSSARPACAARRSTRSSPRPCPASAATMSNYARALTQRNNLLRAVRDGTAASGRAALLGRRGHRGRRADRRLAARDAGGAGRATGRCPRRDRAGEEPLELRYLTNSPPLEAKRRATRSAAGWPRRPRRSSGTARRSSGRTATTSRSRAPSATWPASRRAASSARRSWPSSWPRSICFTVTARPAAAAAARRRLLASSIPQRRAHLVRRIGELPQAFVTTTTTDDLDPALVAAATVWEVTPGRWSALRCPRRPARPDEPAPTDAPRR